MTNNATGGNLPAVGIPAAPPDGPVILPFAGVDHIDETSDLLRVVVRSTVKQVRITRETMMGLLATSEHATDALAAIVELFADTGEG